MGRHFCNNWYFINCFINYLIIHLNFQINLETLITKKKIRNEKNKFLYIIAKLFEVFYNIETYMSLML